MQRRMMAKSYQELLVTALLPARSIPLLQAMAGTSEGGFLRLEPQGRGERSKPESGCIRSVAAQQIVVV